MPSRSDDLIGLIGALTIALGTVALAHLLPTASSPAPPSTPSAFENDPSCAEWGDGCIVCQRTDQGPSCSMPGIACVPGERKCLKRGGA